MSKLIQQGKYILTSLQVNSNKFWNIELYEDGFLKVVNGRVGSSGQVHEKKFSSFQLAEREFNKKITEKERKGYVKQQTVSSGDRVTTAGSIKEIARREIVKSDNPILTSLIDRLASENIHNILSSTTLSFDQNTGSFSTPLGLVTLDAISSARSILNRISINSLATTDEINSYLQLIPQKIPRTGLNVNDFVEKNYLLRQFNILDSLEAAINTVQYSTDESSSSLFNIELDLVSDRKVIERISNKYFETLNRSHASSYLKPKNVYLVDIKHMSTDFENKGRQIGNIKELWHGTRVCNVLSILKCGFVIPPANASHCTGRLFGNGIYFAIQSSKSLNYSYGYWDKKGKDDNCFMFLADVALGDYYVPKYAESLPKDGFDSTWAKPGHSGISNDEIIVYNTYQVKPTYLIEFSR